MTSCRVSRMVDPLATATLDNLRLRMADTHYDWLILGVPQHVAYATGYRSVAGDIFSAHRMAVLVSSDEVVFMAPAADGGALLEYSDDDHEPFGRFSFEGDHPAAALADRHDSFGEALEAASRRFGVSGTAGVDGGIDDADLARLGTVPGIKALDVSADTWIRRLRSVKLPGEVERLEAAARLAEDGISAALLVAEPGMREVDLVSVVAATMVGGGGFPRFLVVTSGERSSLSDARGTERKLHPDDLARFDVGCTVDGYWSDSGRTAVVGEPDALTTARYAAIAAGEEAEIRAITSGVSAAEIFDLAVEVVERSGVSPYRRQHCGHGIGMDVYKPPIVAPGVETLLEPGTVLCVETPFYEIGWGGMMVEDTVVVTPGGNRRLTRSDRSLRVIDA
jgi:Xaa-Pro aminopeptidase